MEKNKRIIIITVLVLMVIAIFCVVGYYWYNGTYFVETDNASVSADTSNAVTLITAKLTELNVQNGDTVNENSIIARQDMKGQNVSNVENSVVRSPISGIVLQTSGIVGEVLPAGTIVAVMANPSQIYINANIQETDLHKVKMGQKTDVTIDQYAGVQFEGKVTEIGQASTAFFSILPQQTSGTYTKVIQTIPVKISIEKGNYKLVPGTNAYVKIHVK